MSFLGLIAIKSKSGSVILSTVLKEQKTYTPIYHIATPFRTNFLQKKLGHEDLVFKTATLINIVLTFIHPQVFFYYSFDLPS